MKNKGYTSRRGILRGLGAAISLPALSSLAPSLSAATSPAGLTTGDPALAKLNENAPKRLSVFYLPNGMRMDSFRPKTTGADYPLSEVLSALDPLQDHFSVITGLAHNNANALGDPGGAHGRSCAAYLTGAHPKPTEGSDLFCGISMDQQVASAVGASAPFPSLQLGIEPSSLLGSCDIGFSCTYTNTISWRSPTQALPVMVNPRSVFVRMYGEGPNLDEKSRTTQFTRRASILDFVQQDARKLARKLASNDRRKLDEYLTSVREVEHRIQRMNERDIDPSAMAVTLPAGIPQDFQEHVRLMIDLQVLALQSDMTRVCTFMLGRELSNRAYPEIGVPDSHHSLSHHGGDPEKIRKLVKISRYHWQQFGYLLKRLADTQDAQGSSLLTSTLVLAGASLGESNDHDCMDLPAIIAGGAERRVIGGVHHALEKHTPMSNLLLSLMQGLGMPLDSFGDSTGNIPGLFS